MKIEDGVSAKRMNSTVAIVEVGGGQEARRARRGGEARRGACLPETGERAKLRAISKRSGDCNGNGGPSDNR